MGRPPRPRYETPTQDDLTLAGAPSRLRAVAQGFSEFVTLARELGDHELELRPPGGEGDFSETLFELSAAIAHVLARHQDHYASEAFFPSAATTLSLQRHGRRIGYRPAPGLSASGVIALTVRDGLAGEVAAGLACKSSAHGEQKPQDYETLVARKVDAAWNEIRPAAATAPITYTTFDQVVRILGSDHDLTIADPIAIGPLAGEAPHAYRIVSIEPDAIAGQTVITLDAPLPAGFDPQTWSLWAKPRATYRLFGHDANPERFPADALRETPVSGSTSDYEWELDFVDPGAAASDFDLLLDRQLGHALTGPMLVLRDGALTGHAIRPDTQRDLTASFRATVTESVTVVDDEGNGSDVDFDVTYTLAKSTTAIQLSLTPGTSVARSSIDPRAQLLGDFELQLGFATTEQSHASIVAGDLLELDGQYALEPGMLIVLTTLRGDDSTVAEIERVITNPSTTSVRFALTGASTSGATSWELGDLRVLANVVPISHGKTRVEVLGDSDGVTPHLRLRLAKPRVTQLIVGTGIVGAAPALIVRVADVEWTRVEDFSASGPHDRHYRTEIDDAQFTTIIFGDGRKGAIPAKGRRHLIAEYRVGLGQEGNVDAGRITKLAGTHPLIRAVDNPVAATDGAEPAGVDALRREATRYIQTFDRAVSAADHAALALLFPGCDRANAGYSLDEGLVLVAADAEGEPLTDASELVAYLQARRDTSLALTLRDPEAVDLHLDVALEFDRAYKRQLVEQAVRDALTSMFGFAEREFGEAAHLSQIYARLARVAGVRRAEVTHFGFTASTDPAPEINDVLLVGVHQWIALDPTKLSLSTIPTETAP